MAATPTLPPQKQLVITWFDETKEPLIKFTGFWSMPQMNSLDGLIVKAYRKHVMDLQKKGKE